MNKTLYYILKIIVAIYATGCLITSIAGIVLSITEHNVSFLLMVFIFILLFALCIFLDKKLKRKIVSLNNTQNNISNNANFNTEINKTSLVPAPYNIKENPSNTVYIQNGHIISHADGSSIKEEEIPYLIELGYQNALEREKNNPNPAFHRTEREEDLVVNFMLNEKNFEEAKKRISKFEDLEHQACNESNYERKMDLYNQVLEAYEKAKNFCYRTKGGMIWFQDMYEYLHNSKNSCFSYADTIRKHIEYYTEIHLLETQIHTIIEDNKEYLQKDLYRLFPNSSKDNVQRAIKNLVEQNIIEKIKQGNTYSLTIKGLQL